MTALKEVILENMAMIRRLQSGERVPEEERKALNEKSKRVNREVQNALKTNNIAELKRLGY